MYECNNSEQLQGSCACWGEISEVEMMRLPGIRENISFYNIKRIDWRSCWKLFEQRSNMIRFGCLITLAQGGRISKDTFGVL